MGEVLYTNPSAIEHQTLVYAAPALVVTAELVSAAPWLPCGRRCPGNLVGLPLLGWITFDVFGSTSTSALEFHDP